MSAIKSKNTKPEILVRKFLWKSGVSYRCNVRDLPGKPDISVKKFKLALDVHGCFWHGHTDCKNFSLPKSRTQFWKDKIAGNIERDRKTKERLESLGFQYFVIWECQLTDIAKSEVQDFINLYFIRKNTG